MKADHTLSPRKSKLAEKEAELLRITNSLNLAQEVAKLGSWDYDVQENYVYCSDPLYNILGITNKEVMLPFYENFLAMICPEDRGIFDSRFQHMIQTGTSMDLEYRVLKQDHTMITVLLRAVAKRDHNGKINRVLGVLYDISDRVITEKRLKESEEKFETIARNLDVGIWSMLFPENKMVYVSPAIEKISGFPVQDFISGPMIWVNRIHPEDIDHYRKQLNKLLHGEMLKLHYRILNTSGEILWVEDKVFPTLNSEGQLVRLDGIIQNISERKRDEEKMNFIAYHDYLTELPNRRMFNKELEQLAAEYPIHKVKFALFYLDMDRFKFVNDTLGHEVGDALLCEVSARLSTIGENHRSVYRLGGDEFAIIQPLHSKDPMEFGKELMKAIEQPFQIEGYEFHITTSIGISIYPDDGDSLKQLMMNTDAALFRAKDLGKNNVQLFTKSFNHEAYRQFALENDLRKAILREEFILHYQPRIDTVTGEVVVNLFRTNSFSIFYEVDSQADMLY